MKSKIRTIYLSNVCTCPSMWMCVHECARVCGVCVCTSMCVCAYVCVHLCACVLWTQGSVPYSILWLEKTAFYIIKKKQTLFPTFKNLWIQPLTPTMLMREWSCDILWKHRTVIKSSTEVSQLEKSYKCKTEGGRKPLKFPQQYHR